MKYILFAMILFVSGKLPAQDCTEISLMQKTGIWKEGMKGSVSGISQADLDKEKKVVAVLHNMIKSKYTPMGVEADYNGSYDRAETEIPVNFYDYNIYFMPYVCENNIIKTAHETSTTLSIAANRFDGKIYETPDENNLPGEGFYSLINMPVEKDGYFYFEENASLGFGMNGKSRSWLITYDAKLPFTYVTRKEFLEKQKQMLLKTMPGSSGNSKEILSFKNALTKIETLLKMPAGESGQPAIVKRDPNDYLSYLFTTDDDSFGRVLIKPNPGYFNNKLSRSTPQFFLVNITGNEKDNIAAKVIADVMKDIDFSALKNMLGK
jgi:hypothetical protein